MAKKTISVAEDQLLRNMLAQFSVASAQAWLRGKFDAYDPDAGAQALTGVQTTLSKDEKSYFSSIRPLGFIKGLPAKDGLRKPLVVAVVTMARELTDRTSRAKQFALAKRLIQCAFTAPGVTGKDVGLCTQGLFFFADPSGNFRLSLVTCGLKGRRLVSTTAKRQSFFCRANAKNNIVKRQLDPAIRTFEDLQKAFSVEGITKEFYTRLFAWYQWACDRKTGVTFPNKIHDPHDDREKLPEAIIRLITRLMFVWFVREKGLVPDALFDRAQVGTLLKDFAPNAKRDGTYYRAILQNLFFATLNCPEGKRHFAKPTHVRADGRDWAANDFRCATVYRHREAFADPDAFERLMRAIPFLNCALFDCLDRRFDPVEDADDIRRQGGETEIYLDGFSRDPSHQAFVPNCLFFYDQPNDDGHEGLLALFEQYEFTVDENTADDADVALDPELLGKVFENLLGAFNPETQEIARNATGSFYTPREIVDYMTDESLKNYLKTKVPALTDAQLARLFDRADEASVTTYLAADTVNALLDALYACKILDPACGSGAFPMGLLHRMTQLFEKLDANCLSIRREIRRRYETDKSFIAAADWMTEKERAERLADIEEQRTTNLHHPDYTRKLFIIENCIYGVDIQPIATQISKLRFFISLLCDQLRRRGAEDEPGAFLALPNLEAKFACANTLIALPSLGSELDLSNPEIKRLREQLAKQRRRYFFARTYATKQKAQAEERQIRRQIQAAVKHALCTPNAQEIAKQTEILSGLDREYARVREPKWITQKKPRQDDLFGGPTQDELAFDRVDANATRRAEIEIARAKARSIIAKERAKATQSQTGSAADAYAEQVANWNPYDQNASSPFFDPDWMFGIKDGFDIVIGNPPYIQLQANGGELAKVYQGCGYETFDGGGDIYCLFYEKGFRFLTDSGILAFITSDKWMCCKYGFNLRKYLLSKTAIEMLLDFNGQRLFDTATVETNVLIAKKSVGTPKFDVCAIKESNVTDLVALVNQCKTKAAFTPEEFWIVRSASEQALFNKIKEHGTPLRDWNVKINFGVKTGLDEAFLIDNETRRNLIQKDSSSRKIIRPIFRGKDIGRYAPLENPLWLIATFPALDLDIDNYPAVKQHLLGFGKRVLAQSGEKNIGGVKGKNARKKTSNKWFETQDQISFYKEFSKPKVMWKRIGSILRFCYSDSEVYGKDTTCMMTGEHMKYLCAFLNSQMGHYLLKDSPRTGTGDLLISVQAMEPLLVVRPDSASEEQIVGALDSILAAKKADPTVDTSAWECEIDQLVYQLYGLTEEEIAVVEGRDQAKEACEVGKQRKGKVHPSVAREAEVPTSAGSVPVDDYEELD